MKLAEALIIRSDLQKKFQSLQARLHANVLVQEDSEPAEAPDELLAELMQVSRELHALIYQIHRTNATATLADGQPMLQALALRDEYEQQHKLLLSAIEAATPSQRYGRNEIKWQSLVDVKALQKQADDIAVKLRALNMAIQAANWQVSLIDDGRVNNRAE
ncbi:septicolysin [Moraxella caviae]|uniref:Septicolysin n=2 Tax=Moraxella caviae TaxID=34060 RepID=A0A1T0A2X0_9GAMM|nr:DIP1984 family protein [Moraxella caviae]OOR90110.1 septicolysin [Moraxella caviae]STZ14734.1 Uncharacterised protein [Moraxella caviae]VEW14020.1 Uncharacterised protein [Moraxella caviae]